MKTKVLKFLLLAFVLFPLHVSQTGVYHQMNAYGDTSIATSEEYEEPVDYIEGLGKLNANEIHGEIDISAYRHRETLKIKIESSAVVLPNNLPCNFYIAKAEKNQNQHTDDSYMVTVEAGVGVTDFVYLSGTHQGESIDDVRILKLYMSVSAIVLTIDVGYLDESYVLSDMSFAVATTNDGEIICRQTFNQWEIDVDDPLSYVLSTPEGIFTENGYNFFDDGEEYLENFGLIDNRPLGSTGITGEIEVRASRQGKDVALMFGTSLSKFPDDLVIVTYLDASSTEAMERSADTWCLRISPSSRQIIDYFCMGGVNVNQPISRDGLSLVWGLKQVKIKVDLAMVNSLYSTRDLGIGAGTADDSLTMLGFLRRGSKILSSSNPSTFVWIDDSGNYCDMSFYNTATDQTEYVSGGSIEVNPSASTTVSHANIDIGVFRQDHLVTFQFVLESGVWSSDYYVALIMEIGDSGTTSRTDNSFCIRLNAISRSVRSYFYLGPTNRDRQIQTTNVIIKTSDAAMKVTLDLRDVNIDLANDDFGFTVYTTATASSAFVGTHHAEGYYFANTNPSSFMWFHASGDLFVVGVYNPTSDSTAYKYLGYLREQTGYFNQIDIYIAKVNSIIITKYVLSSGELSDSYYFHFYVQIGGKTSTTRTDNCAAMRLKPASRSLFAFFTLGPSNANQSILTSSYASATRTANNSTTLQVKFDLRIINGSYGSEDIGFTVYASTSSYGSLGVMARTGYNINTGNPSTYVWMNINGDIIA